MGQGVDFVPAPLATESKGCTRKVSEAMEAIFTFRIFEQVLGGCLCAQLALINTNINRYCYFLEGRKGGYAESNKRELKNRGSM